MRRMMLWSAVVALFCGTFLAISAPSADELLGKAREKATKDGKSIFVDFSASW